MTTKNSDMHKNIFTYMIPRTTGEDFRYVPPSASAFACDPSPLTFTPLAEVKTPSDDAYSLSIKTACGVSDDSLSTCHCDANCSACADPLLFPLRGPNGRASGYGLVRGAPQRAMPSAVVTTADLPPALLNAFLAYAEEIISVSHSEAQRDKKEKEEGEGESEEEEEERCVRHVVEFITIRISGDGAQSLYPQLSHLRQSPHDDRRSKGSSQMDFSSDLDFPNKSRSLDSIALLWFLREYKELAATTLKMGNCFLFNLSKFHAKWKKAIEVPFMALQLLATFAYTMAHNFSTDRARRSFNEWGLREHLVGVTACLYIAWKFADVDANVATLLTVLERRYFVTHGILRAEDVLQAEFAILRVCGLRVAAPRWFTVAMEVLSAYNAEKREEEEQQQQEERERERGRERRRRGESGTGTGKGKEAVRRYMNLLERLLCTCENVLVSLMAPPAAKSPLRQWAQSHVLFGVALVVASCAVDAQWAAAHIAPTAPCGPLRHSFSAPSAIRVADAAAQRELTRMAAHIEEVVRRMGTMETG